MGARLERKEGSGGYYTMKPADSEHLVANFELQDKMSSQRWYARTCSLTNEHSLLARFTVLYIVTFVY